MILLLRLYHFLGSLSFTLILFTCIIVMVCLGTFLESITHSHRYAAVWTYGHPLFFITMLSLFVNILFSATRRWPFQKRHIPFLMTHLGLLFILSGVFIKGAFGLQGHMNLLEGSGSHRVLLPNQQMIRLKDRHGRTFDWHVSPSHTLSLTTPHTRSPHVTLIEMHPHGKEYLELWNKRGSFTPHAVPPVAVGETHTHSLHDTPWQFRMEALADSIDQDLARQQRIKILYQQEATLSIHQAGLQAPLYIGALQKAMEAPLTFSQGMLSLNLHEEKHPSNTSHWQLHGMWSTQDGQLLSTSMLPLDGEHALQVADVGLWPMAPYSIQITRTPAVNLLVDEQREWLVILGAFGSLQCLPFSRDTLETVYAAEGGFGGYFLHVDLPSSQAIHSPENRHAARLNEAIVALQEREHESLDVPQQLFQQACYAANTDFSTQWITFLDAWQQSGRWLYEPTTEKIEPLFSHLNWNGLPPAILRAMQWSLSFLKQLQVAYAHGKDPNLYLKEIGWPISIPPCAPEKLFSILQNQLFTAAAELPAPPEIESIDPSINAAMLSVLLRQYTSPFSALWQPSGTQAADPTASYPLYCQIHPAPKHLPPLTQLEEETPVLRCLVAEGEKAEQIDLVFDATENRLPWPVLQGQYLAQCIPDSTEIPYHVRLRDARKLTYPDSEQAVSYEAEILITDRRTGAEEEVRLSMNRVHETADGHRFYLSSLSPSHEESVRHVRLAVSYDPLRATLTYLGAFFVATGTLLLLFRRSSSCTTP